jgi:hypothetical protein
MSKTNTEGFAVIKWLDDNQFGIVAIKSIVSKKGEQVVVDKIYQVLYGNDHLQAQIKLLGSKDNCKQLLDSLTKSIVVQSAQKKSTTNAAKNKKSVEDSKRAKKKKPSSSQRGDRCDSTKSDNESNDADFADDSTKMTKTKSSKKANKAKAKPLPSNKAFSIDNNSIENDILKVKLSETSALLKEKEQLVSELTTKIANLTALNESYKNLISDEDRERMIQFSTAIFKAFGTEKDILEISHFDKSNNSLSGMVMLNARFPSIMIESHQKIELAKLLKAGMKSSLVFKSLMSVYYPRDEDWTSRNANAFYMECPTLIESAIAFIKETEITTSLNEIFSDKLARSSLTCKHSDANKKIKNLKLKAPASQDTQEELDDEDDEEEEDKDSSLNLNLPLKELVTKLAAKTRTTRSAAISK